MKSILRDLPFFDHETKAAAPTGEVIVRPYQIVVWVSITRQHAAALDSATPRFPALLDTGNNHNFSLQHEHLLSWAGAEPANYFGRRRLFVAGQPVPLVSGNVWLHRNKAGERDSFSNRPAICLELPEGIRRGPAARAQRRATADARSTGVGPERTPAGDRRQAVPRLLAM